jgi:hypothetical protein
MIELSLLGSIKEGIENKNCLTALFLYRALNERETFIKNYWITLEGGNSWT